MGGSERKSKEKRKHRKSASSSEDEKRSKRPRAAEDEERESRRSDKREKRKEKKSHKHSKSHSGFQSKVLSCPAFFSQRRSRRIFTKASITRRTKIQELSKEDYFSKNNEFATWLKDVKNVYFSDLSSESARELFSDFVELWNDRKLESRYYEGISSGPRTSHNWKIKG
ncbi:style cell-cycle inhibitor 1-A isoform X1 [Cucumis melo]|uniref:Style cell-cycle inhibitor 1-A isoform X1 n=1 Tax=Cucumis melo TaxID=3656 RepID=A0A1S3BG35_CUCME|nr:style cell-cycle inhibitor 1-A isoform X1 [Cucumis melo]